MERATRPGVLVFNLSLGVLYMNQEAQELSSQLIRHRQVDPTVHEAPSSGDPPILASDLLHLSEKVARALRLRADAKDWGQVYIRRRLDHQGYPLVMQAFGIPDVACMARSLIILLLEERKPTQRRETARQIAEARERFQFTEREQSVAAYLARGMTNKEIASTLGITEQTIKVHVKHIMEKTASTTRTAVLAQLLQVSPPAPLKQLRRFVRSGRAESCQYGHVKAIAEIDRGISTAWLLAERYRGAP